MNKYGFSMAMASIAWLAAAQARAEAPAAGAKAWTAPASASQKRNPNPPEENSVIEGKSLFVRNCLPCHGTKGDGDGPAAAFLDKHPGVLSDPKMWLESDGALFWKISKGNPPMPPFGLELPEAQRWELIAYIRTLAPKPAGYVAATVAAPAVARHIRKGGPAKASEANQGNAKATEAQATAAETQNLTREIASVKENLSGQIAALKDSLNQQGEAAAQLQEENAQALEDLRQDLAETQSMAKEAHSGTTKMMVVGYGTAGYTGHHSGDGAMLPLYDASFNPLMLWKLSDRLLFEGEMELEMEGSESFVNLEVAQSTYLLNDYLSFGAGKFLNPMSFFVERQHMNWVNKLPDKPLAVYDGLLPESEIGFQLRGVAPMGSTKLEYAAFLVNAPLLITDDSTAFGTMEFNDFDNVNGNLAAGGRIGFIPLSQFEIGYGAQVSEVGPAGKAVMAYFHSVDVNYIQDADALKGILSVRGQWVWSKLDAVTYDAGGALGFGPVAFDNYRHGGYAQVAYRPSKLKNGTLKKMEPVIRYDAFLQRNTPVGYDEYRLAAGLDYWIRSNVVFKGAYEVDRQRGGGENGSAYMFQFVSGF